jgi:hypothetical protein
MSYIARIVAAPSTHIDQEPTMNPLRPLACLIAFCLSASVMPAEAASAAENDGRHDFDFAHGRWTIHNRKMVKALADKPQWEEWEASTHCWPTLAGMGNQDEFTTPTRPGVVANSLRFFNPKTRMWSIYWVDSRNPVLDPPVVGRFEGGVGIFEGPDTYDGKPIVVRYTWSRTKTEHPRWEQAFSTDGGKTWETNWIMDLTRVGAL